MINKLLPTLVNTEKAQIQILPLLHSVCTLDDEKAFETLFRLFYSRLFRFAQQYVHSRELAEEVVSDVFVKLWNNRKEMLRIEKLETYLFTAVKNQSLNYFHQASSHAGSALPDSSSDHLVYTFDPGCELEWKELQAGLETAIDKLPVQCRMVFKLIKEEGLSYKETAEILNISPRTVETQLVRALRKISVALSPHRTDSLPSDRKIYCVLVPIGPLLAIFK